MVLWCSGYHICLTRRRSPVRNRAAPALFVSCKKENYCGLIRPGSLWFRLQNPGFYYFVTSLYMVICYMLLPWVFIGSTASEYLCLFCSFVFIGWWEDQRRWCCCSQPIKIRDAAFKLCSCFWLWLVRGRINGVVFKDWVSQSGVFEIVENE